MIQADIIADFSKLDKLGKFASTFETQLFQRVRRGFNQRIRLGLLSQLRKTPRRRYWTDDDFVSDAQRRAFFAKTGGKAYQRTGDLARAWQVNIVTDDHAIAFAVENKTPYEQFVSGRRQQKGHAKTGWPLHSEVFQVWRPRVADMVATEIDGMFREQLR